MKQLMLLAGFVVLLAPLAGCQNTNRGVKVIIEGGGEFPEFLVGEWKADKDSWKFVFEPDGTISSAVISLGRVRMKPGQVTTVPMKKGGKGVFEPGEWAVHYAPAGRVLTVKIVLKNFHMELGKDVLEGKSTDIFVGQISQNEKVWQVDWTSFPDYTAHTADYPNFKIYEDPNYGISKILIFEKVTDE
jgi:predicted small secreted protein